MNFHAPQTKNKPNGKFIVIYGTNNIGKSTQAKLLVTKLNEYGVTAEYVKYAIYSLIPSGVILNDYLRKGNLHKLTPREAQIIQALNRTQYESVIKEKLRNGITIVAEDYTGTGLAWGMGSGVDEYFLKYINSHLLREDLALLMDGHRFAQSIEANHEHETNHDLMNKVRLLHLKLAQEYNWPIINANDPIPVVHKHIWQHVEKFLHQQEDSIKLNELIELSYPEENIDEIDVTRINYMHADNNPQILHENSAAPSDVKQILINKVTNSAKTPTRTHDNDAGLDIYADDNYTLFANDTTTINTGIRMAIPDGYAGFIWDKSGLASQGLKTAGGVIDAGYRGEIKIVIINLSGDVLHIVKGQKIAQMIIQKISTPTIKETNNIGTTKRNDSGFGSSGLY